VIDQGFISWVCLDRLSKVYFVNKCKQVQACKQFTSKQQANRQEYSVTNQNDSEYFSNHQYSSKRRTPVRFNSLSHSVAHPAYRGSSCLLWLILPTVAHPAYSGAPCLQWLILPTVAHPAYSGSSCLQ